ncbi:hypothetical protein MRB53_034798 [Persea americana]|uniref:Uncharacterized protein n=1 Tax=Persea americana TaxID=3435 RepID=A0ACC2K2X5_PERAE|nr:hypothetical protein MRB53_034798 [Persea americana]
MGFNFVVECKRGKENTVADALSRRKDKGDGVGENCAISRPLPNWLEALKEEIKTKPTLHQLRILISLKTSFRNFMAAPMKGSIKPSIEFVLTSIGRE